MTGNFCCWLCQLFSRWLTVFFCLPDFEHHFLTPFSWIKLTPHLTGFAYISTSESRLLSRSATEIRLTPTLNWTAEKYLQRKIHVFVHENTCGDGVLLLLRTTSSGYQFEFERSRRLCLDGWCERCLVRLMIHQNYISGGVDLLRLCAVWYCELGSNYKSWREQIGWTSVWWSIMIYFENLSVIRNTRLNLRKWKWFISKTATKDIFALY